MLKKEKEERAKKEKSDKELTLAITDAMGIKTKDGKVDSA